MAEFEAVQGRVQLANASAGGSTVAPQGLHVYLDVPPRGQFRFQHFVIEHRNGAALLVPADGSGGTARFDADYSYWCLWSTQALSGVGSTWGEVAGFGYPLLARWERQSGGRFQLVLPNTRDVQMRMYNMTGQSDAAVAAFHANAVDFYQKLHVRLVFSDPVFSAPPSTHSGPWTLDFTPDVHLSENGQRITPNFGDRQWSRGTNANTVMGIWVRNVLHAGLTHGLAVPVLPIVSRRTLTAGFRFPSCAIVFLEHNHAGAMKHELGHVLQADCGWGRDGVTAAGRQSRVMQYLSGLKLEERSVRPRGSHVFNRLFRRLHAPSTEGQQRDYFDNLRQNSPSAFLLQDRQAMANPHLVQNLMNASGGTHLLPWQVAVMRDAPQLR